MRFILIFLLIWSFTAGAYASVENTRACCLDEDCPVTQCIELGCLPPATPAPVLATAPLAIAPLPPVRALPGQLLVEVAQRYDEVWTPPD